MINDDDTPKTLAGDSDLKRLLEEEKVVARRSRRNQFLLMVYLSQRRGFCVCCYCFEPALSRRARRIFRIVRAARPSIRKAYG